MMTVPSYNFYCGVTRLSWQIFSVWEVCFALDKPYISSSADTAAETSAEVSLEFGSATQLFLVPFVQHKEQVCVSLTPNRHQGSRLLSTLIRSQSEYTSFSSFLAL
ncbi:hypothetical protein RchiOBHm_Chr4g0425071 [Rosa chinensis]|uniref:Uncharacterized protein n=1 Tax=Rosa chinensis TaxID=74649 RepID=A0A2P6QZ26_ROSCH|nr:hypothetical protein RchiOBHm_Chr4g0425071 [Rosa chinensis]